MNLLVIDTSSTALSLALSLNGELTEFFEVLGRQHSQKILPVIDQQLAAAGITAGELDYLGCGQGPGSFTGLRIGAGVIQGLAFGLDIPAVTFSTLATLAQQVYRLKLETHLLVALQARDQEVYWGQYSVIDGIARLVTAEKVVDVHELDPIDEIDWIGVGDGWRHHHEIERSLGVLVRSYGEDVFPRPLDLVTLAMDEIEQGHLLAPEEVQPVYLRETVATKPGKRA